MKFKLSPLVMKVLQTLESGGFEIYVVGGAVRDILTKTEVKDWDFTTDATPEEIQKLFPDSFYDNSFGTVGVELGKKIIKSVKSIGLEPKIGEWVSVHWGCVCEVLSARQLGNLEYYTKLSIMLANRYNAP